MAVNFTDLNGLIGFPTLCLPPFHSPPMPSRVGVPVGLFSTTLSQKYPVIFCVGSGCEAGSFRCGTGRCIPASQRCDGTTDCSDNSDEIGCPQPTCESAQFQCLSDGECIPQHWVCDDEEDCEDGSDERQHCPGRTCSSSQFTCTNGACIPGGYRCDRVPDCLDGADERNCFYPECSELRCANGACYNRSQRCDQVLNCRDGSDEANCTQRCSSGQFQCNNGECIPRGYVCDHDDDCGDRSDEQNCTYPTCRGTYFTCPSGRCIHQVWLCDGEDDCEGNADERGCDNVQRECYPGEWPCPSSGVCIPLEHICDGTAHCLDGEDETNTTAGRNCSIWRCASLSCEHHCRSSPDGGTCACPSGYVVSRNDSRSCIDYDDCSLWGMCDQLCADRIGSHRCSCRDGYLLEQHKYCRANPSSGVPSLIFSNGRDLLIADVHGHNVQTLVESQNRGVAVGVDFHYQLHRVFWTDTIQNKVFSVDTDGSRLQVVLNVSVDYPENLAVDWVNNKLYVVEASVNRIDMVDLDGSNRVTLIAEHLGNPRGLALDPTVGYLFFSDWDTLNGEPGLERAYMDGTNRYGIIRTKLGWPAGITLDLEAKRVYWVDSRYDYIETTTYDGLHRKTVVHGGSVIPHPFGITLFEHSVYYTDWTKMAVMKANKYNDNSPQELYRTSQRPHGLTVVHAYRQPFASNPCGTDRGGCEHICVLSHRTDNGGLGYRCRCRMGFDLHADGKRCASVRQFLLFSSQLAVRGIPFNLSTQEDIILPITGTPSYFVGVDFSAADNSIFFSDTGKDIIYKQKIDGTGREVLAANRVDGVEDLAYDWISKNLYWTDPRYRSISVMKVADKSRRTIVRNLNNPRSIVVHPVAGYIFWTDWYRPAKIMRAWGDGSHAQSIVNTTLGWPNGLSIDWSAMRLYWVDAFFDKIEHSNFDGQNRLSLDRITQISHPFGLTVFGGYVYFTDWRLGGIVRVRKTDGGEMMIIRRGISHIMHVKSFNADSQIGSNFCNRQTNPNGDCSHFCFPAPYSQRVCGCPYGMKLEANQQTCVDDPSNEPPTLQCGSNSFSCTNGKCVPQSYQCDGVDDCHDNSDEANCGANNNTCSPIAFTCANQRCVPRSWHCDGHNDCFDGSDERDCPTQTPGTCQADQFSCANHHCIPRTWLCDTDNDCGDGSDENNCDSIGTCHPGQFQCPDHRCIDPNYVCDGDRDCADGADEQGCVYNCTAYEFKCANGHQCVNSYYRCDGVFDCNDRSDESGCPTRQPGMCHHESEFQCQSDGSCVPSNWECDGHPDCEDGSDEHHACPPRTCPTLQFRCDNGNCVFHGWICDGDNDCRDGSDERDCPTPPFRCPSWQWQCPGHSVCVNLSRVCDNTPDCPNGADESPLCNEPLPDQESCSDNNAGCTHGCIQGPFGAQCTCPMGFQLSNDSKTCEDIDECHPPGVCSQHCFNERGSFRCHCQDGYTLEADGRTCKASGSREALLLVSSRNQIVSDDILAQPNVIRSLVRDGRNIVAVDFDSVTDRIYWSDTTQDRIWSAHKNGTDRTVVSDMRGGVLLNEKVLQHPHAITIFEDFVYWTDRYVNRVIRANKWHGQNQTVMLYNLPQPMGLVAVHPARQPAGYNPCDPRSTPCTHICLLSAIGPRFYSCACPSGWTLTADQFTCARVEDPFLVVVRDSIIYGIPLNPNDKSNDAMVPVAGLLNGYDVDFDDAEQMIYWVEHPGEIHRVKSDGTNRTEFAPAAILGSPVGLALDWMSRNLYYSNPASQSIEVLRLKGEIQYRKTLITNNGSPTGAGAPVGIAVDPARGKMYWTDQGTESGIPAKVASADMDGSNAAILFTHNLEHVEFITIDIRENKLYWAVTGTGVIERGDPDGSNRITMVNGLSHPWGVAVYDSYLYFTDRDFEVIERVDKATGLNRVVMRDNVAGLRVLKVHYRDSSAGWSNGCSNNVGTCEQLCLPRPGGLFSCACATGFKLSADNRTCSPYQSYVVISMLTAIKGFSLEGADHSESMVPVAGRGRNALHVDVHMPSGFIYWCDFSSTVASQNGIRTIKPDGSGFRSIVTSGIGRNGIRGIAVDWAAGNLYFTNAFLTETYIEVIRLNTTFRRVLLKTQVDMPRHIAVDPMNRYLFWADYGQTPKIERAFLDGSNRTVLVSSGIVTPRGLALDHRDGYIYWVDDSLDMIARVRPDGGETEVVRYGSRYPTPYGVTVFEGNVIWVDRNLKKVFQASKQPGATDQPLVIRDNINMLRDVTIFDRRMQPSSAHELNNNPCLESNGGCAHFCFAIRGFQTRKCSCAYGNLAVDSSSCVVSRDDYLIYTTESTVRSLRLDPEDHSLPFPVVNLPRTSVALDFDRLDGRIYFTQSSGAGQSKISFITLASPTSSVTEVASDLGAPDGIAYDWINKRIYYSDYINQSISSMAVDGSQRTVVAQVPRPRAIMLDPCRGYMYWTDWGTNAKIERATLGGNFRTEIVNTSLVWPNGLTLDYDDQRLYWADAIPQAAAFISLSAFHTCEPTVFTCGNGRCVPYHYRCDHYNDCGDNSDETGCIFRPCDPNTEFTCNNARCIAREYVCNGINNCYDNGTSDEQNCAERTCQPEHTKCQTTNICIPRSYLCDGDNDCGDNSDESPTHCATSTCSQNEFRCSSGRCIPGHWYCDGGTDCNDGSDEPVTCTTTVRTCNSDQFRCDDGRCIASSWICDGDNDCGDMSDEDERHNCANRTCSPQEFTCINNRPPQRKCIPWDWVCDGDADCSDAYDEHQNCTRRSCSANEFTCNNGLCIRNSYRCDRRNDCADSSDEQGCTYQPCQQHQFTCQNGRCVSQDFVCDGDNDCGDESDELDHLCRTPAPTCPPGNFRCDNGNCIPLSEVCDRNDDCNDNSDEKGCGINECTDPSMHHCDHNCTDTPTSFICTCRHGYHLMSDNKTCDDVDECSVTPSVCSQVCENTMGSYVCKCAPGFLREPDGRSCRQNSNISPYLIFSNRYYLRNLSSDGEAYSLILQGLTSVVALDFDRVDRRLYWIDVSRRVLERMFFNGTGREVVVNGISHGEGLAVDWVGRKLYWVDSFLDCMKVSELDGRFVRKLAEHCVDANNTYCFENPRAIVLHPKFGYVYWTDWGDKAFIGRVGMDGNNKSAIIITKIEWPNGLTIDYTNDKLYWSDAHLNYIEFSDLDGNHRHTVYDGVLPHPFAITVFEESVYWTDWNTRTVEKGNKYNGSGREALVNTTHRPFDIHVCHPYRQPIVTNPCAVNNGGCSHLCLLRAGGQGFTCECPDHFLTVQIGGVARCLPMCSSTQYRCADNERCIPIWWKCDGQRDCRDGSDEPSTCPVRHCRLGQFQCNDGNCSSPHFLCNSNQDCPDGSDEDTVLCATHQCESHQWQCANKRCISEAWQCDGENDCGDGSDEDPAHCSSRTCRPGQFKCRNGRCIPQSWKCDVDDDCGDNSDEPIDECMGPAYRCDNHTEFDCRTNYRCVPLWAVCNGHNDCRDNSDEQNCEELTCEPAGDFRCDNHQCIPLRWRCDGDNDCGDGSDEHNCTPRPCTESEYRCDNLHCIPDHWVCDHDNDCEDNSDERDCELRTCHPGYFQCGSGHCISERFKCDGNADCLDFTDESSCPTRYPNSTYCPPFLFECKNHVCVQQHWICDGDNDCGDNSDEELHLCLDISCDPPFRFRCDNTRCIYSHELCNSIDDCGDGTDERPEHCVTPTHGPCSADEYKCGNDQCIPLQYACDDYDDCEDQTDELGCYYGHGRTCSENLCEHNCTDLSTGGFICSCRPGYKPNPEDRNNCNGLNECEIYGTCPQLCRNTKGSYECFCADGFRSVGEQPGVECAAEGNPPVLLLPDNVRIRRFNLSSAQYSDYVDNAEHIQALDYLWDPEGLGLSIVFWTVLGRGSEFGAIKRAYMTTFDDHGNNPVKEVDLNLRYISSPDGIAVDWIGGHIYWTDAGTNRIEVSKLDGRYRKWLIHSDLDQPAAIVVNPGLGLLNPCQGVCSHLCLLRPGGYTCACPQGSTLLSFNKNECDAAIEAEVSMPLACRCMNGGTCYTDEGGLPKCKCPYGYSGSYCEMGKSRGAPAGTAVTVLLAVVISLITGALVVGVFLNYKRTGSLIPSMPKLPSLSSLVKSADTGNGVAFHSGDNVTMDLEPQTLGVSFIDRAMQLDEQMHGAADASSSSQPSPFGPPPKPQKREKLSAYSPTEDTFTDTANLVKEDSEI
ncbi:low-density lipoprotein receptor-related protein 2a [Sinocyclocheilus grahami]|uniref:low-density lipoprotein receptor-related protein 2a n=1 Tax=Sinocyclocheilus grahami TaxID=75366 RepID=UPI0007AD0CBF|nr:PREDICTED: low-density lipoprotein receptor-related protein 2-like [Sinocyclocheilus grahami]